MPDLGIRGNVMGPQPIAQRQALPLDMLEMAARVVMMFQGADGEGLAAMCVPAVAGVVRSIAAEITPGTYTRHEIAAVARVIHHYYLKVRMFSDAAEPFTLQFRLGERDAKWRLWEVINLTGRRAAWTR